MTPKWPKMTQNDPKMTPKWPQNDQKSIFSKMFLHHFWPFLGWFGVVLGCFERLLVIFGPRNAFKWPYLGSKMAQKWTKNRFSQKYSTWLLGTSEVVWRHFRLLWAVFGLQWPQTDPQNDPQNDLIVTKMTTKSPTHLSGCWRLAPKYMYIYIFFSHTHTHTHTHTYIYIYRSVDPQGQS